MKKTIGSLIMSLKNSDEGAFKTGFLSLKGGNNLMLIFDNAAARCDNTATCDNTNDRCNNTKSCADTTNTLSCTNSKVCFF